MHEYLTTKQIVESVLSEAEKHGAKKVLEVHLTIGKLTVLGIEQVKFYYELLTKETIMENSRLIIEEEEPLVKCENCGYKGNIHFEREDVYHFLIPTLTCPKCGKTVKIVKGKEVLVKSVKVVVEEKNV
jgi:hydrogenase nickel incorporation protein HypA/HybF